MTLTIDDDVASALKGLAAQTGRPFEQVMNDTLRRGLSDAVVETGPEYVVGFHRSGFRPCVDPMRLNQLNDSLEAGESASRPSR